MRCGCGRSTDTWAQCPETGQQGLHSTSYDVGKFSGDILPDGVRHIAEGLQLPGGCTQLQEAAAWLIWTGKHREVLPETRPALSCLDDAQWDRLIDADESFSDDPSSLKDLATDSHQAAAAHAVISAMSE